MLQGAEPAAAVFIGGMEGIPVEFELFTSLFSVGRLTPLVDLEAKHTTSWTAPLVTYAVGCSKAGRTPLYGGPVLDDLDQQLDRPGRSR